MKHATPQTLAALAELLGELRALPGLTERKEGVFYRKSQAFLHFHEDDDGAGHADVKRSGEWHRFPVGTRKQHAALLSAVRRVLNASGQPKRRE